VGKTRDIEEKVKKKRKGNQRPFTEYDKQDLLGINQEERRSHVKEKVSAAVGRGGKVKQVIFLNW